MKNPNSNDKPPVWKDTAKSIPQMEKEAGAPGYEFYLSKQASKNRTELQPPNPRLN